MDNIAFDGQQTDERVLAIIRPHTFSKYLSVIGLLVGVIFFLLMLFLMASQITFVSGAILVIGVILILIILFGGLWWIQYSYKNAVSYVTDRRIIRFEPVSPVFKSKRALFWNEVLKAKAYSPNMLYRMQHIGTVEVEPQLATDENIIITNVYMFDDMANYIDKILFTFKNKPAEVSMLKPFVAKPKGERDSA